MSTDSSGDQSSASLEHARTDFLSFAANRIRDQARVAIFHDVDADGIAAGVVLTAVLQRMGHVDVVRFAPNRARNAWSEDSRERIRAAGPAALFVLDLGSRKDPIISGLPTCFIDHHRPDGCPPGDVLISGYDWDPIPSTSALVHLLAGSMVELDDLEWVTALGIISDLGEKAPFAVLERAKKKYKAKWLKEATVLVNAIRRSADFDPEVAARAIIKHVSPKDLVSNDTDPDVAQLMQARREVQAALAEAKKQAPVFAGKIALIRIRSSCQVHPLLAQIWRGRLPGYFVLAANEGYIPGRVNFSARSSGNDSVIDWLRSFEVGAEDGVYGHGHDKASGGSLPIRSWNQLLLRMGFGPAVLVPES